MKKRTRAFAWWRRSWIVGILAGVMVPAIAHADLYKYKTASGDLVISSTPRPDLELVEVIEGSAPSPSSRSAKKSPSSSSSKKSDKVRANMERARSAKQRHVATHGDRHSVDHLSRNEREASFDDIIQEASATYNVPFSFIKAVIRVESAFNPMAVSRAGAQGLMQLMPRVAASLNVRDPFDPRQNIFGGTKLLRLLVDRYDGDINLILAAYNAGDVAVNRYDGIPYPQTRHYVASVYKWYKVYSAANEGP